MHLKNHRTKMPPDEHYQLISGTSQSSKSTEKRDLDSFSLETPHHTAPPQPTKNRKFEVQNWCKVFREI
jgi:hypothetical protein